MILLRVFVEMVVWLIKNIKFIWTQIPKESLNSEKGEIWKWSLEFRQRTIVFLTVFNARDWEFWLS